MHHIIGIVLRMRHVSILYKHYYTNYYCVSSPFRVHVSFMAGTYICVQKPQKHDDNNYTTISPRAETTKTNKREFYFFYSSLSFYDMYCAYRFFSRFFFCFQLPLFYFIFFISRAAYGLSRGIAGSLRV